MQARQSNSLESSPVGWGSSLPARVVVIGDRLCRWSAPPPAPPCATERMQHQVSGHETESRIGGGSDALTLNVSTGSDQPTIDALHAELLPVVLRRLQTTRPPQGERGEEIDASQG